MTLRRRLTVFLVPALVAFVLALSPNDSVVQSSSDGFFFTDLTGSATVTTTGAGVGFLYPLFEEFATGAGSLIDDTPADTPSARGVGVTKFTIVKVGDLECTTEDATALSQVDQVQGVDGKESHTFTYEILVLAEVHETLCGLGSSASAEVSSTATGEYHVPVGSELDLAIRHDPPLEPPAAPEASLTFEVKKKATGEVLYSQTGGFGGLGEEVTFTGVGGEELVWTASSSAEASASAKPTTPKSDADGKSATWKITMFGKPTGEEPPGDGAPPADGAPPTDGAPPNRPPQAEAGGPYSVPEGGSTPLTGSGSDPDGDPVSFAWDLDGDGSFETPGQAPTFSAAGLDGPGSRTVTLQVCDPEGACATDDAQVEVTNVPPTVDAGPDHEIVSGETLAKSASFSDAGVSDAPWAFTIEWGDGTSTTGSTDSQSEPIAGSHTYFVPGEYTVRICVTDKDGGAGCDRQRVTVKRLPVLLNIKPGSDPNSVNLKGRVPLAILTTADFDATGIDPLSVRFGPRDVLEAGGGGTEIHRRGHIEDSKELDERTRDGDPDMVLHFDARASGLQPETREACVRGLTASGVHFEGCDAVRVRGG